MKLYFWDWNSSLTIEKCEMEFPFLNNDDAGKNHCFTNLETAKVCAKVDLRARIHKLSEALRSLDSVGPATVKEVKYIKGI